MTAPGTREQAVITLLRMRFDWIPGPRTWTGSLVARAAQRGEVRETWVECPRCGGRKRMGKDKGARLCDRCLGCPRCLGTNRYRGQQCEHEPAQPLGRIRVDPYTYGQKSKQALERERVTGESETAKLRRRRVDRELWRLELAEMHRQSSYSDSETEPWERAKAALYASGSFAELDRALLLLERRSPEERTVLEVVYGYDGPLRRIGKEHQEQADRAVVAVAALMPGRIRVPIREGTVAGTGRWANGHAQQKRNREIWRLYIQDGLNRAQIARKLGIARETVRDVLAPGRSSPKISLRR